MTKQKTTRKKVDIVAAKERLMLSVEEVIALTGINRNEIYRQLMPDPITKKPNLYSVKVGTVRRISRKCLDEWIATLPTFAENTRSEPFVLPGGKGNGQD